MIPTFQAACKSRATRLGVPPSPDELAAFDQSENLTSMHFKQLYSVLGLPLVQNKKKNFIYRNKSHAKIISCLKPAEPTGPAQPALTAVGGASLAPPLRVQAREAQGLRSDFFFWSESPNPT